jgi:hypothetical protein
MNEKARIDDKIPRFSCLSGHTRYWYEAAIRTTAVASLVFTIFFAHIQVQAATVEYELIIAQQEVNITGKHDH